MKKILLVDDMPTIHEAFNQIFNPQDKRNQMIGKINKLLGENNKKKLPEIYKIKIDHAYNSSDAIEKIDESYLKKEPYSVVFMDVRMPPGNDGIQTLKILVKKYPKQNFVICSAYMDYSYSKLYDELGDTPYIYYLAKPFHSVAVLQITQTLINKESSDLNLQNKLYQSKISNSQLKNQLIHQEKLASLGTLSAGLAHELKGPLHFIVNYTSLATELCEELPKSETKDELIPTLEKIQEYTEKLNDLITTMLAKNQEENKSEISLYSTVNKISKLSYNAIRSKYHDFQCEININIEEKMQLLGRKTEIESIIINLINNAFHAMLKVEGPVLTISAINRTDSILFTISDNGHGIKKSNQENIFVPFFTTKNREEGTGLGLYLVKKMVENNLGTINLHSDSSGTDFTITFQKNDEKEISI